MVLKRKKWRSSTALPSKKKSQWDISPSHAFWGLVFSLFTAAGFFTFSVESHRRSQYQLSSNSIIRSGDDVQVLTVISGNEISVLYGKDAFTVRLIGVRCFESKTNEPSIRTFAAGCERALHEWIDHQVVQIEFDEFEKDKKGRVLAYLSLNDSDIGERLISEGHAFLFDAHPFERENGYEEAEKNAKSLGLGVWNHERAKKRIAGLKFRWAKERGQ